jgi:hypothetical protein
MKKLVLLAILVLLAGFVAYKLFWEKKPVVAETKDQPLRIGKNTGVFNTAFSGVLDDYYSLKDSLVEWDEAGVNRQALSLAQKADSLPFREMKADSLLVVTAKSLALSVANEARGLVGEGNIDQKRRAFNMLTDEIYNLVRTVHYDGQIIYHIRCPMAFNDSEEGFWLTNTNKVVNPYLGRKNPRYGAKMVGCGEVTDSIDFTK